MNFEDFVVQYGAQASAIAAVSIAVVGLVKMRFKEKLSQLGAGKCKTLYQVILTVLVFLAAGFCMIVKDTTGVGQWLKEGALAYTAAQVMYPIYENYHIRDVVEVLAEAILRKGDQNGGKD